MRYHCKLKQSTNSAARLTQQDRNSPEDLAAAQACLRTIRMKMATAAAIYSGALLVTGTEVSASAKWRYPIKCNCSAHNRFCKNSAVAPGNAFARPRNSIISTDYCGSFREIPSLLGCRHGRRHSSPLAISTVRGIRANVDANTPQHPTGTQAISGYHARSTTYSGFPKSRQLDLITRRLPFAKSVVDLIVSKIFTNGGIPLSLEILRWKKTFGTGALNQQWRNKIENYRKILRSGGQSTIMPAQLSSVGCSLEPHLSCGAQVNHYVVLLLSIANRYCCVFYHP